MINVTKLYCGRSGQSDRLRYPERKNTRPIVVFNCTARCNLQCLHCYSASDASRAETELDTGQARGLIDQLAEYRCPVLLFSGGEPLLREDIFELLDYARHRGLRTVLSTNGTLITRDVAERLKRLDLGYAGISLDGPEALHDRFRGRRGSFRATLDGIEHCRRFGIRTGLRFTMTRHNCEHIDTVFDIAEEAGVRRICFYHLIRTGRAQDLADETMSDEQTRRAVDHIFDRTDAQVYDDLVDEVLTVGNHADGPYLLMRMNREQSPLAAQAMNLLLRGAGNRIGQNIASINWDGQVYPDQFWRNYSLGNVLERPFGEIWDDTSDPVMQILRHKDKYRDPKCARCRFFEVCQGNFRSLSGRPDPADWCNEPPCYLTEREIAPSEET